MVKKTQKITKEGKAELEKELKKLIADRPRIIKEIQVAREFGDLSENEEYRSARSAQKLAECRIAEIEEILKTAEVMKPTRAGKIAVGGTTVIKMNGKEKTYQIVQAIEADPLNNKISDVSPIGKALLGHKAGETIEFNGKSIEILSVN